VLPPEFLDLKNFELAFERISRGQNRDYKDFFRHLLPPYRVALHDNLIDLLAALKRGHYEPGTPETVYRPKKSGVLRPQRVLCLSDQIVYQAIANLVASGFLATQRLLAGRRCFGAQLADYRSPFFFKAWKPSYRQFGHAVKRAISRGRGFVAEFDLVSFYELVDHAHLQRVLSPYCPDPGVLELLFRCLAKWTAIEGAAGVDHGLPQGPEASALLAECFLLPFDQLTFRRVTYLRYVDDVKLFAENEGVVRRGLVRLDIESKKLGLVPQAQKMSVRRVSQASDVLKVLPSSIASMRRARQPTPATQARLERLLMGSILGRGAKRAVTDETRLKFALYRMAPRPRVLRALTPLFLSRPDLSMVFAQYLRTFKPTPRVRAAAIVAFRNAVYDGTAADFLHAYRALGGTPARSVVAAARRAITLSEEKGISLRFAFRALVADTGPVNSLSLLRKERPLVRSMTLAALLERSGKRSVSVDTELRRGLVSPDEDFARFCADKLLPGWAGFFLVRKTRPAWLGRRGLNRSVRLYVRALGLSSRRPPRRTLLPHFFRKDMKIAVPLPWGRAVPRQRDRLELERRCLELKLYSSRAPDESVLMLDAFNEGLIQAFSRSSLVLAAAFKKCARKNNAQPDYGVWLNHADLAKAIPSALPWLQQVHTARVSSQLGHSKNRKGGWTAPISHRERDRLWRAAPGAWASVLAGWRKML